MSKKNSAQLQLAGLAMALVLCDMSGEGLLAGHLVQAAPDLIAALKGQGIVDDHEAAVAHALSQQAKVQRPASELRAEAEESAARAAVDAAQAAAEAAPPAA